MARPARPTANIATPATTAVHGSVTASVRQATKPRTLSARGQRRCSGRLREGRRVRDRVVGQHPERREADRTSQVGGEHEHGDSGRDSKSGVVGNAIRGMDRREPARKVAVPRHREARAPDARDQCQQRAEARDGRADADDRQRPRGAHGVDSSRERPGAGGERIRARCREGSDSDEEIERRRRSRARVGSRAGSFAPGRAPLRRALRSARSPRMRRRAEPPTGARRRAPPRRAIRRLSGRPCSSRRS